MLQPLELKQALTLASLLLEFEAESTQADEWRVEVRRAKLTIDQAIARPAPPGFFLSAQEARHKVNEKPRRINDDSPRR